MTAVVTPLMAYFVFEPYLALFSLAAVAGTIAGLVFGAVSGRFQMSSWLKAGLLVAALPLTFALALAVQSVPGLARSYLSAAPSWAMFAQSAGGFLFGWGLCAMVETYYRIFERSGRPLAWGLLGLRIGGILLLLTILANPVWKQKNIDPGRVVVVLDNSRSMSLTDSGGVTRYDRAKAAVSQLTHALDADHAGPRVAVDLYDVNGDHQAEPPATPTVDHTNLTRALQEATLKARGSHLVTAVVLVSDGMDNTGRKDFGDWEETSVPIDGLGFAAVETGNLDLAVRKPTAPERARIHNELRISVPVVKSGAAAAEATVALKLGRDVLASQRVNFGPGPSEQVVTLAYTPHQAGDFVFTASIETTAGERNLSNNEAQFPMRIDADPIRVLYIEGFLRYEYKYLKARLEDDPDVALVSVVRRVNPEGLAAADKDVLTADELKHMDVVILGDMEGKFLSAAECQQLLHWLDEKNHSLLLLGGYKSFGPEGLRGTPLADALPVVFAAQPPLQSEEAFHFQLTDKGQGHPIFTLSGDRVKDAEAWNDLPPLRGMSLVERVKPGAEELAVNPGATENGKPAVVAAVQRAGGGGQVMVLTVDSTWLWSRLPRTQGRGDALYGRFWSQTVRWLAGRGRDEQRPLLTVFPDKPYYEVGKGVALTIKRQPRADVDLSATQVSLEIIGPDGQPLPPERTPTPHASSRQPDVFTAEFTPSVSGRYEVNAALNAAGNVVSNQTTESPRPRRRLRVGRGGNQPGNAESFGEGDGRRLPRRGPGGRTGGQDRPQGPDGAGTPLRILEFADAVRGFSGVRVGRVVFAAVEPDGMIQAYSLHPSAEEVSEWASRRSLARLPIAVSS